MHITASCNKPLDAVIIGSGISGLSAAYMLFEAGHSVIVLEKNERFGGRTYLKKKHGISYAVGTQYLDFEAFGPMLKRIYSELDIIPRPIPAPFGAAWDKDGIYIGEEGMLLRTVRDAGLDSLNNLVDAVDDALSFFVPLPEASSAPETVRLDDETGREWLTRKGVSEALIRHINVEIRSVYGASIDEISASSIVSVAPFVMPVSQRLESKDVAGLRRTSAFDPSGVGFHSFTGGIYDVVARIGEKLDSRIQLGSEVIAVERLKTKGVRIRYNTDGGEQAVDARLVISAVQAPAAVRILGEALDSESRELLAGIDYAPLAIVSLFSEEPIFDEAFVLHAPDGRRISFFMDSTWFRRGYNEWEHGNRRILNALVVPESATDRRILSESDSELVQIALAEIEQLFPGARDRVTDTEVTRHPLYGPILRPGSYKQLSRLHELIHPPILLAGDYLRAPQFNAAAETGRIAGEKALKALRSRQ